MSPGGDFPALGGVGLKMVQARRRAGRKAQMAGGSDSLLARAPDATISVSNDNNRERTKSTKQESVAHN